MQVHVLTADASGGILDRILRTGCRWLLGEGDRNSIHAALVLSRAGSRIKRIGTYDETALVIAPHMDDEIAGCGGTMALHRAAGASVQVVFTTDGAKGGAFPKGRGMSPAERQQRTAELVRTRRAESQTACAMLGVSDITFLDGPDGMLSPTPRLVDGLRDIIAKIKPRVIYHPWLLDAHSDHWQTNRILRRAVSAIRAGDGLEDRLSFRGYEVWTPVFANAVTDISTASDLKQKAFAAFASQNAQVDYPRTIMALNMYRAITAGCGTFAEAFHELTHAEFSVAVDAIERREKPLPLLARRVSR